MQRTKPRPANPEAQGIDVEIVGAKQVRGLHFVRSDHDRVHKDRKGAAAANGPSGTVLICLSGTRRKLWGRRPILLICLH